MVVHPYNKGQNSQG